MATITTGNIPRLLWEGIKELWGFNWQRYEKQYPMLLDVVDSNKQAEDYVQKYGLGPAKRKPETEAVSYDQEAQGFVGRITNLTYGLGYIISEEAFMNNLYAEAASAMTPELLNSLLYTQESVSADVYNQAFTASASYYGPDGVCLCSTAHPNFSNSNTWANTPTTGTDLAETSLEDMVIMIRSALDDRGLPVLIKPNRLITAKAEEFNAQRILKSAHQSGTANNDTNVLKDGAYIPEYHCNVYLTSAHAWFIKTSGIPKGKGLIFQNRLAPRVSRDNDFDTDNMKVKAITMFGVGWADPHALYGNNGP